MRNFDELVSEMSISDIIRAMVKGLENPFYRIDMHSFGRSIPQPGGKAICYGCAATNCIYEISKIEFDSSKISFFQDRAEILFGNSEGYGYNYLRHFEIGIDRLRQMHIIGFFKKMMTIAVIDDPAVYETLLSEIPLFNDKYFKEHNSTISDYVLTNNYTNEQLDYYRALTDFIDEVKC